MHTNPIPRSARLFAAIYLSLAISLIAGTTWAAPEIVVASPDITIDLTPTPGSAITDQGVVADNLLGIIVEESLGSTIALRAPLEVDAYHDEGAGNRLFVLDQPSALFSAVASPGDVIRFDGATYTVIFDASANGIPSGVKIDAVTRGTDGELVFSVDTFAELGSLTVADEDLFKLNGSAFESVFDGSDFDVPGHLDVDAASYDALGMLFLSFDTGGVIDGVAFDDEDVLEYDPFTQTWAPVLAFDASVDGSGGTADRWIAADLSALHVPEPTTSSALMVGTLAIGSLIRARRKTLRPCAVHS